MLKAFYNPDQREMLEYHERLLKIAEQERLADEAMQPSHAHSSSLHARFNLKELFRSQFSYRPGHGTLAFKEHK
jgi:predicted membrane-bound mannosyltransferase